MKIYINDKPADITLDNEKTLGDVMAGIEQWIFPSGNRIQEIIIDGKKVHSDSLEDSFSFGIESMERLDIQISPWRELAAEALGDLYETCVLFKNAAFNERPQIFSSWQNSYAGRFLASEIPDIYGLASLTMTGEGLSPSELYSIIEERLREIVTPEKEIDSIEGAILATAERMEQLPLDMQTGKDRRADETIHIFSGIGEKLFRLFSIYKSYGNLPETLTIDGQKLKSFIEEFNTALRELSLAYENRDTVLAGDISEYELAPRLVKLFTALKGIKKPESPALQEPLLSDNINRGIK